MPRAVSFNTGFTRSLLAQRERNVSQTLTSLERLSTGRRINRASDDPAGLIAAEGFRGELTERRAELRTYEAQRRSLSLRESTLSSVQRQVRELQGQVVSATNFQSQGERQAIQQSVDASLEAIDLVAGDSVPAADALDQLASGEAANLVDGDTELAAEIVDDTADQISDERIAIGVSQRELQRSQRLTRDQIAITSQALSQVEDTDFAEEASRFVQSRILTEAATAALAFSQRVEADAIGSLLDEVLGGNDE